jgi:hypothetical protein
MQIRVGDTPGRQLPRFLSGTQEYLELSRTARREGFTAIIERRSGTNLYGLCVGLVLMTS